MAENKTATESTNAWLVASQELDLGTNASATGQKVTLQTAGKFLDRNIEVAAPTAKIDNATINSSDVTIDTVSVNNSSLSNGKYSVSGSATIAAPTVSSNGYISTTAGTKVAGAATVAATVDAGALAATVSSNTNGSASMAANGFTASTDATSYAVDLTTVKGAVKAKASVGTAGYVVDQTAETIAVDVDVAGNGDTLYIPEADVTADVAVTTQPSAALSVKSNTAKVSSSATSYQVVVKATTTAGAIKATSNTTGLGMVSATDTAVDTDSVTIADVDDLTINIQAGTLGNAEGNASGLSAYADNTSVIVPAEGYLTISEGYYPATKISLDQLLEGNPDATAAIAATDMLSGAIAYNVDGQKITGTIPTITAAINASDGQVVSVPKGYIATAQDVKVANGSITGYATETTGEGDDAVTSHVITPSAETEKTITVSEGWLESDTITVKKADATTLGQAVSTITATGAAANVTALTIGAANISAAKIAVTGSADISGSASAKTSTAGYTKLNDVTGTGDISGTANVNATLDLYVGAYTLG